MSTPHSRRLESETRIREEPGNIRYPVRTLAEAQVIFRAAGIGTAGMRIVDCSREFNAALQMLGDAQPRWTHPPLLVQIPDETMGLYASRLEHLDPSVVGFYIPGTNVVVVSESHMTASPGVPSESVWDKTTPRGGLNELVCHEIVHYLGHLERGYDEIVFRAGRRDAHAAMPHWLEEGLVMAITGHVGPTWEAIYYPEETLVSVFLDGASDDPAILREAFISGDFREFQQSVDRVFGPETFRILIGEAPMPGGSRITNGGDAFVFLLERARERDQGFEARDFMNDPRAFRALWTFRRFYHPIPPSEERSPQGAARD